MRQLPALQDVNSDLRLYYVILEVLPEFQKDPNALSKIHLRSNTEKLVPLSAVTSFTTGLAPLTVNHVGQLLVQPRFRSRVPRRRSSNRSRDWDFCSSSPCSSFTSRGVRQFADSTLLTTAKAVRCEAATFPAVATARRGTSVPTTARAAPIDPASVPDLPASSCSASTTFSAETAPSATGQAFAISSSSR